MGALNGPRRKQYDPYLGRSGDFGLNEYHETQTVGGNQGSGVSVTLLTVPVDKRYRILRAKINDYGGTSSSLGLAGQELLYALSGEDSAEFSYEDAPVLDAGETVVLAVGAGFGAGCRYSVVYGQEDIGRGYYQE